MTAPDSALISVDLPAPLSPMTPRISSGIEVEIGVVERGHPAVALDQAARLQRMRLARAPFIDEPTFRIHWSMATATMIRTPTVNSCQSASTPAERQAVAEHADDQRADQRADDRAAAAEQAGAADHHGGDASRGWRSAPACGLTDADAADQHPAGDRADEAGDDVDREQRPVGADAGQPRGVGVVAGRVDVPAQAVRLSTYQNERRPAAA